MQEDIRIDSYNRPFLQVPSCMYDFLASFSCMAYACGLLVIIFHWHGGMPGLIMDLLSLLISWIAMVLWVLLFFFGWFSCSFGCGLSY